MKEGYFDNNIYVGNIAPEHLKNELEYHKTPLKHNFS